MYTIAVFADDPRNDATLHVDQYTGKVLVDVRWQDYNNVARATELGVMLAVWLLDWGSSARSHRGRLTASTWLRQLLT